MNGAYEPCLKRLGIDVIHNVNVQHVFGGNYNMLINSVNSKDDLIPNTTPKKQDKTSELDKHWSPNSTPARNEVIRKMTCPVN